jgi:hypothetical protein
VSAYWIDGTGTMWEERGREAMHERLSPSRRSEDVAGCGIERADCPSVSASCGSGHHSHNYACSPGHSTFGAVNRAHSSREHSASIKDASSASPGRPAMSPKRRIGAAPVRISDRLTSGPGNGIQLAPPVCLLARETLLQVDLSRAIES